jgi:hypothetical protein
MSLPKKLSTYDEWLALTDEQQQEMSSSWDGFRVWWLPISMLTR